MVCVIEMKNKLLVWCINLAKNHFTGFGTGADCVKGLIEMLKKDTECVELDINGMESTSIECCMFDKRFYRKWNGNPRDKANKWNADG